MPAIQALARLVPARSGAYRLSRWLAAVGDEMRLTLPYPPTANTYWRHPSTGRLAGRHLISQDGRNYRKAVDDTIRVLGLNQGLRHRLSVDVLAFPPDRRRRDLDNLLKPLLDSLQHAGVFIDDCQIDNLRISRGETVKFGSVLVTIERCGAVDEEVTWREAMREDA